MYIYIYPLFWNIMTYSHIDIHYISLYLIYNYHISNYMFIHHYEISPWFLYNFPMLNLQEKTLRVSTAPQAVFGAPTWATAEPHSSPWRRQWAACYPCWLMIFMGISPWHIDIYPISLYISYILRYLRVRIYRFIYIYISSVEDVEDIYRGLTLTINNMGIWV